MAASMLKWFPGTLYNTALNKVVEYYKNSLSELKVFPPSVQFDVLHELYEYGCLSQLREELCDLDVLARMLKVVDKRHLLHHCFQALMDQALSDHRTKISTLLSKEYVQRCSQVDLSNQQQVDSLVVQGLSVSTFLAEAGWLPDAEIMLTSCQELLADSTDPQQMTRALECCHRLLHVQNGYCRFEEAERTYNQAMQLVKRLQQAGVTPNLSSLYSEFSTLYMLRSNYAEAYSWSVKALYALVANFPKPALIDVLRQSAKACVLKREFKKAGLLIKQAVMIATEVFGDKHPKYADTLIDYGFYLLNVDAISQGVQVYKTALEVRQYVFGGVNLHVAIAHEDLAYASYVHNYAFGKFDHARTHAERAIDLMLRLLPEDHLLLSSSKRVKALILEEMAIDNPNKDVEKKYLAEAHSLHKEALAMAMRAFGEMNVQTAKHYGNLGRLYQSMRRFQEAEEMHLKAIMIKEQLLGPEDYEVALSVGHLASLYNYDMMKYDKAESLYLRSIAIGKKLFGEAYSGLEYDYRGLLRVYSIQANMEKCFKYQGILAYWKLLRDEAQETQTSPFVELSEPLRVLDTVNQFMTM
ncbi:amyloid protein-binding protein 2 isoform X1 [Macrobrachium rosenbergii]|uniref:amyloid protein-binding protein 2 isoform X1 n=2 Tax=Macrobrachium rosenbergii TaxID=79674 RepID=UPI0034D418F6